MPEYVDIHPVIFYFANGMDGLAGVIQFDPGNLAFEVDMVADILDGQRALGERLHSFRNAAVVAVVLDACNIEMPGIDAVISPSRLFFGHRDQPGPDRIRPSRTPPASTR